MHSVILALSNAINLASFPNKDVEDATKELIDVLGDDLEEAQYVEPIKVNRSLKNLQKTLEEFDASNSDEDEEVTRKEIDKAELDEDDVEDSEDGDDKDEDDDFEFEDEN